MLKKCHKCKTEKDIINFGKDIKSKNGIAVWCKECNRKAGKENYKKNSNRYKENAKKHRKDRKSELRTIVDAVKDKYGCVFCKEKEQCVLDFHHVIHRKDVGGMPVTRAMFHSRGMLIKEINKCIVVCANCHRKLHAGLLVATLDMLCKEKIVYKPRIFLPASKLKRCSLSELPNGDWYIRFLKPHSVLDRSLILTTEEEKAIFAASCRRILAPSNWGGNIEDLPKDWKEQSLSKIRRCPEKYYEMAKSG